MKTIYFCGLREIHRKQAIEARGWWVAGGGREWTKAGGGQNIITINIVFSGAGRKRTSRRESERGLMKYRSEMVSPLHQGNLRAWTLAGCGGEQGERSNETEKDNAREGEHKSRGSVFRGRLLNSDLSDIMICRATWRACPGSVWRKWRGESAE